MNAPEHQIIEYIQSRINHHRSVITKTTNPETGTSAQDKINELKRILAFIEKEVK